MGGRRSVYGILSSMPPRGSGVYAGAFRRRRAGRTGALAAPTLALAMLGATPMARPQTSTLPVVTITADATEVREGERAEFTIRRTGATTAVLRGSLYVTGADASLTYAEGWAFAFRQGEASKGFGVTVLDDGTAATDRQVSVRVDHRYPTYTQGTPGSATMTVIDTTPAVVTPAPVVEMPETFELPGDLQPQLQVLGDRVRDPAKAWTAMAGEFVNRSGVRSQIRVIQQASGYLRVEGLRSGGGALRNDGGQARSAGTLSPDEADVMESFAKDTMIGLFTSVDQGAAVGLLGHGFRPDASAAPNYAGPSYDIFEMVGQVYALGVQTTRGKRFYFDSDTGLLMHTRYRDGGAVETRFSNWTAVDGSMYPSRTERYENGVRAFSFTAATITASAAAPTDASP